MKISSVYTIALTGFVYKRKSWQNDCRLPKAHPMARQARKASMDPGKVQVFHIIKRCVRRAFLCGFDRVSNRSLAHRKQWLRERMEFLNSVFAIDCLTYAIMSNHCHLILRSRPDLVAQCSDHEIAVRWLRLCPRRKDESSAAAEPTTEEINIITSDSGRLEELRRRLSDISWWVKMFSQKIAQQANQEDQCTGHFWEGRFKSQALLDEAAILACAAYVDLNPIRAAIAETPETSQFTGIKDRIDDTLTAQNDPKTPSQLHQFERTEQGRNSGWMLTSKLSEELVSKVVVSKLRRTSLTFLTSLNRWSHRNRYRCVCANTDSSVSLRNH